jgi:hypothetical protein
MSLQPKTYGRFSVGVSEMRKVSKKKTSVVDTMLRRKKETC